MTERGTMQLDENGNSSILGVFGGGDITRGGATVLLAMKDGLEAAMRIDNYLKTHKGKN